jgi:hypothetical protein
MTKMTSYCPVFGSDADADVAHDEGTVHVYYNGKVYARTEGVAAVPPPPPPPSPSPVATQLDGAIVVEVELSDNGTPSVYLDGVKVEGTLTDGVVSIRLDESTCPIRKSINARGETVLAPAVVVVTQSVQNAPVIQSVNVRIRNDVHSWAGVHVDTTSPVFAGLCTPGLCTPIVAPIPLDRAVVDSLCGAYVDYSEYGSIADVEVSSWNRLVRQRGIELCAGNTGNEVLRIAIVLAEGSTTKTVVVDLIGVNYANTVELTRLVVGRGRPLATADDVSMLAAKTLVEPTGAQEKGRWYALWGSNSSGDGKGPDQAEREALSSLLERLKSWLPNAETDQGGGARYRISVPVEDRPTDQRATLMLRPTEETPVRMLRRPIANLVSRKDNTTEKIHGLRVDALQHDGIVDDARACRITVSRGMGLVLRSQASIDRLGLKEVESAFNRRITQYPGETLSMRSDERCYDTGFCAGSTPIVFADDDVHTRQQWQAAWYSDGRVTQARKTLALSSNDAHSFFMLGATVAASEMFIFEMWRARHALVLRQRTLLSIAYNDDGDGSVERLQTLNQSLQTAILFETEHLANGLAAVSLEASARLIEREWTGWTSEADDGAAESGDPSVFAARRWLLLNGADDSLSLRFDTSAASITTRRLSVVTQARSGTTPPRPPYFEWGRANGSAVHLYANLLRAFADRARRGESLARIDVAALRTLLTPELALPSTTYAPPSVQTVDRYVTGDAAGDSIHAGFSNLTISRRDRSFAAAKTYARRADPFDAHYSRMLLARRQVAVVEHIVKIYLGQTQISDDKPVQAYYASFPILYSEKSDYFATGSNPVDPDEESWVQTGVPAGASGMPVPLSVKAPLHGVEESFLMRKLGQWWVAALVRPARSVPLAGTPSNLSLPPLPVAMGTHAAFYAPFGCYGSLPLKSDTSFGSTPVEFKLLGDATRSIKYDINKTGGGPTTEIHIRTIDGPTPSAWGGGGPETIVARREMGAAAGVVSRLYVHTHMASEVSGNHDADTMLWNIDRIAQAVLCALAIHWTQPSTGVQGNAATVHVVVNVPTEDEKWNVITCIAVAIVKRVVPLGVDTRFELWHPSGDSSVKMDDASERMLRGATTSGPSIGSTGLTLAQLVALVRFAWANVVPVVGEGAEEGEGEGEGDEW